MATNELDVRTEINNKVKLNKKNLITGPVMNGVLNLIVTFIVELFSSFYTKTEIDSKLQTIELSAGADGKSAYQIWLAAGNTGTEAEYLTALKGAPGANAPLVKFKYSVDGITNWHEVAISNDFYLSISVDNGSTWDNALKFKGSEGVNGKSSFQLWQAIAGNETKTLTDYWTYLATLGGFAYNLIFDNTASIELSQPRAWIITTLTWVAASISKVSYSTDGIIFTTATNGVNNIQVAANTILYLQITFASGTQAVVFVAGTY